MTNKITKAQMFNMIKALEAVQANADMVAFIDHELELLAKKASTKKPAKETEANDEFMSLIRTVLSIAETPMTVTQIREANDTLVRLSTSKVSSLLKTMIKNLEVEKITDKKKSTFKLAD